MATQMSKTAFKGAAAGMLATMLSTCAVAEPDAPVQLASTEASAMAFEFQSVVTPEHQTGKDVIFKYGPGVNLFDLQLAMDIVAEKGCKVTAEKGGMPFRVISSVGSKSGPFKDSQEAAWFAIKHCSEDNVRLP